MHIFWIPDDLGISSTFNIKDLVLYHAITSPFVDPFVDSSDTGPKFIQPTPPPPPLHQRHEQIEGILDEQTVSTRQGGYQEYLVKWKGRPKIDNKWLGAVYRP